MPITLPPLVVTGQVISAAYANATRAAIASVSSQSLTWTQTVNAAGFGVIGAGNIGCDTVSASGVIAAAGYSTGGLVTAGSAVLSGSLTVGTVSAADVTATGTVFAGALTTVGQTLIGANLRFSGPALRYMENESQHLAFYVKSGGGYAYYFRKSPDGHSSGSEVDLLQLNEVGEITLPQSTSRLFVGGYQIGNLSVTAVNPVVLIRRSGGAADEKHWDWESSATGLTLRAVNDAYTAATAAMVVSRSGATATSVSFPAGVVSPLTLNAEVLGGFEGGQINMRDAVGSGYLALDNNGGSLRVFRSDGNIMLTVSGTSGRLKLSGIVATTFETQAAAIAAGLVSGEVFWTSTGILMKV